MVENTCVIIKWQVILSVDKKKKKLEEGKLQPLQCWTSDQLISKEIFFVPE